MATPGDTDDRDAAVEGAASDADGAAAADGAAVDDAAPEEATVERAVVEDATVESSAEPEPAAARAFPVAVALAVALGAVMAWALLIVGAVVMDAAARDRAAEFAAERVRAILGLEPDHPVSVDIGGAPLMLQLWAQRLDRIEVTAADVSIGELAGDVRVTAIGVPFDRSLPLERVDAEVRVGEELIASIASRVTNIELSGVDLDAPLIKLSTRVDFPAVEVLGVTVIPAFQFDVGMGVEPFVADGRIGFTPVSFSFDGNELSAESFADTYRHAAESLMQFGAICVADQLPEALRLESAHVHDDELIIGLGAANAVLSAEALATRGTCE